MIRRCLIILGRTLKESREFKREFSPFMKDYNYIRIASTNVKPSSLSGLTFSFYTLVKNWHEGRHAQEIRKMMGNESNGQEVFFAKLSNLGISTWKYQSNEQRQL